MSSELMKRVALFTRDLLGHDEQLIRIGRENFNREDYAKAYIIIDAVPRADVIGTLETYDGDAEEMSYGDVIRAAVTLDFYGEDDGAYDRAKRFRLMTRSQQAYELKRALGIDVGVPAGVTDLKIQTGQEYGERYQVEASVLMSESVTIDTKRIDIAQFEIRNEDGVIYNG